MRDPEATIRDIATYARRILRYMNGVTRAEFREDTAIQDQVIRCLGVIGEAARRTPETARVLYPTLPWQQMIGMRNRLAHEHDGLDMDAVWLTATRDIPAVLAVIEPHPSDD